MEKDRRTIVIGIALALGTLLLYAPALTFDFCNFDDPQYVINNFHLSTGSGWHRLAWALRTGYGGNWIPLVWVSYILDYWFYGLNPGGYHATNVLLHTATAVLLFLVLKRMTGAFWRSAMVAALFAWHPVHVESVAWIAERKDVLSALFWMLTLWAYLNYAGKGGRARYCLVLLFFTLGLMAKAMLVTLPFVLWLLDWWPLRRFPATPRRRIILEKIPMLLLAAGCCLITVFLQKRAGALAPLSHNPLGPRFLNALVSYCRYLEKTIWPSGLSVIYPLPNTWPATKIMVAGVVLAAVSALVVCLRKKYSYLIVGWFWFLGTLVPVIGLVQVGAQGMADRYMYVPSIGLFMMICWGGYDLWRGSKLRAQWPPGILCLASLAVCGGVTSRQLPYWRDGGALFSHALAVDPGNYVAHATYGMFLFDRGMLPQARVELERAVQISPYYARGHTFLGRELYRAGEREPAAAELRLALRIKPDEEMARDDLISLLLDQHLPEEAAAELATALRTEPDNPLNYFQMGRVLAMQGRPEEARAQFSEALRLYPQMPGVHYQLGLGLATEHKTAEAIAQYRAELSLQPRAVDALNNMAWILATDPHAEIRNGREAVELARRACALTRNKVPLVIGTLAAAYAEAGHFEEAMTAAQSAHDLAAAQGRPKVAAKNLELLELFRARRPYHENPE